MSKLKKEEPPVSVIKWSKRGNKQRDAVNTLGGGGGGRMKSF